MSPNPVHFVRSSHENTMADAECQHLESADSPCASTYTKEPSVYVVLLNWNGWHDTLNCVRSLYAMEYTNWHAILVDNGSSDDSVERIREAFPHIEVIKNGKNLGFATGNNVGIRSALQRGADYVLVLNNDTTVLPDSVREFVRFAEKHPDAAMIGPKILGRDPEREWPIRRKLDLLTLLSTLTPLRRVIARVSFIRKVFYYTEGQPSAVEFLPGSALFFPARTFEKAGLFDESTFLDFEELIMAEKVRRVGSFAYFVPQAKVWHKGSASASKLRAQRYIENAKSEEYFLSTYVRLSPVGRSMVRLVRFLTYSARSVRYRSYREHFNEFMDALLSHDSVKVRKLS